MDSNFGPIRYRQGPLLLAAYSRMVLLMDDSQLPSSERAELLKAIDSRDLQETIRLANQIVEDHDADFALVAEQPASQTAASAQDGAEEADTSKAIVLLRGGFFIDLAFDDASLVLQAKDGQVVRRMPKLPLSVVIARGVDEMPDETSSQVMAMLGRGSAVALRFGEEHASTFDFAKLNAQALIARDAPKRDSGLDGEDQKAQSAQSLSEGADSLTEHVTDGDADEAGAEQARVASQSLNEGRSYVPLKPDLEDSVELLDAVEEHIEPTPEREPETAVEEAVQLTPPAVPAPPPPPSSAPRAPVVPPSIPEPPTPFGSQIAGASSPMPPAPPKPPAPPMPPVANSSHAVGPQLRAPLTPPVPKVGMAESGSAVLPPEELFEPGAETPPVAPFGTEPDQKIIKLSDPIAVREPLPKADEDRTQDLASLKLQSPGRLDGLPVVQVQGIQCPIGHHNHPAAQLCTSCGRRLGVNRTVNIELGPRPPLGVLLADDGSSVSLDANLIIGREPNNHPDVLAQKALPWAIPDSTFHISREHLAVYLDGWSVLVQDLGSANGTRLLREESTLHEPVPNTHPIEINGGDTLYLSRRTLHLELHHIEG